MHIKAETLDDALRRLFVPLLENSERVLASRGETNEIVGVLLEIEKPRARISRSETRGKRAQRWIELVEVAAERLKGKCLTPCIKRLRYYRCMSLRHNPECEHRKNEAENANRFSALHACPQSLSIDYHAKSILGS